MILNISEDEDDDGDGPKWWWGGNCALEINWHITGIR